MASYKKLLFFPFICIIVYSYVCYCKNIPNVGIIGGNSAHPGQFPFLVSVQGKTSGGQDAKYEHLCAGSIISDRFILTAAHCVATNK